MIEYNNKPLTEEDACPDLEVLTVDHMTQMAQAVKERICSVQAEDKKYTDDKIKEVNDKIDNLSNIPDLSIQLDALQKIVDALDLDGDGHFGDIITRLNELQTQITNNTTKIEENTTNITNVQNKITNIENEHTIMGDNITNLIGEAHKNTNDMVEMKKDIIDMENNLKNNNACEIYRKVGQATERGLAKFKEILASDCEDTSSASEPDGAII